MKGHCGSAVTIPFTDIKTDQYNETGGDRRDHILSFSEKSLFHRSLRRVRAAATLLRGQDKYVTYVLHSYCIYTQLCDCVH